MKTAAVIKNDEVVNMIVLPDDWTGEGQNDWRPPDGCAVAVCDESKPREYGMGHKRIDATFYPEDQVELDPDTQTYKLKESPDVIIEE